MGVPSLLRLEQKNLPEVFNCRSEKNHACLHMARSERWSPNDGPRRPALLSPRVPSAFGSRGDATQGAWRRSIVWVCHL
jgi:hypothetical protein